MTESSEVKLYPPFEEWLSGEKAPDDDFEAILIDVLENLFPHFAYNQFDIARNPDNRIRYEVSSEVLMILDNPRRRNLSENSGNCMDLVTKAYLLICQKYPILKKHLVFFNTFEMEYFSDGAHQVLVYADDVEIGERVPMTDFEQEYRQGSVWLNGRGAILDPTFGVITGIYDKRYKLQCPVPVGRRGDIPMNLHSEIGIAVPLAITKNKTHVFFDIHPGQNDLLIGFKEPNQKLNFYRFEDPKVGETLAYEPEIMANISALRAAIRRLLSSALRTKSIL